MTKSKKIKRISKTALIGGGVVLTVLGFKVIPPILKKGSNLLYKKSIKNEDINFDDMGPEIVEKKDVEDDNSGV